MAEGFVILGGMQGGPFRGRRDREARKEGVRMEKKEGGGTRANTGRKNSKRKLAQPPTRAKKRRTSVSERGEAVYP